MWFRRGKHEFVVDRLDLFIRLSKHSGGSFKIEEEELFFFIDGLKLRVQTAEELFILNEIFFEQCYNFMLPEKDLVVIDVGMNVGYASLYFATKPEVKKIYSFEPFLPTFESAQTNLEHNPQFQDKIVAQNFGLSSSEGVLEVAYSNDSKGRNIARQGNLRGDNRVKVRLKEASKELLAIVKETEHSVVIKMDCEGAEHEIFDSMYEHDIPTKVKVIMLEWHFSRPSEIAKYLLKNNFRLIYTNFGDETGLIYAFR